MTNILYRTTSTGTPPESSIVKGSPLTIAEFDANLKSLSNDINSKAPLVSPSLTGVPTAPTATLNNNTTQVATTEFVNSEISNKIASKAPLASPSLTGVPTAPTATLGTSTSQIATTEFVDNELTNYVLSERTITNSALVAERNITNSALVAERTVAATLTNKTLTNPAGTTVTLADTATVNWDMNLGQVAYWSTSTIGRTFATPTNYKTGVIYTLFIGLSVPTTQTPNWPASFKFQYNTPPDLTTSNWTILSLIWSPMHSQFLVFPAPGM